MEVSFDCLAELEEFWASIPPDLHRAWSQRLQAIIVDGSPTWEVFRTVEAFPSQSAAEKTFKGTVLQQAQSGASSSGLVVEVSGEEIDRYGAAAAGAAPSTAKTTASGLSIVGSGEEAETILDWKGDPMTINPGDQLPFKF